MPTRRNFRLSARALTFTAAPRTATDDLPEDVSQNRTNPRQLHVGEINESRKTPPHPRSGRHFAPSRSPREDCVSKLPLSLRHSNVTAMRLGLTFALATFAGIATAQFSPTEDFVLSGEI